MNIAKIVVIALLLFTPLAHAETFDPKTLNDAVVEKFFSSNKFICFVVTKGEKKYLVIRDDNSKRPKFIYEAIGPKEKPIFELLWAEDWI
ncbi:MAG: hypothetical protein Q8P23_02420 [bacterium]|nr:hypothetical protein [bacterium]